MSSKRPENDVAKVPNHDGSRRHPADRFFGFPDARIGTLRSASTSLGRRGPKDDVVARGLFGVMAGFGAQLLMNGPGTRWAGASAWAWAVTIIVAVAAFWLSGPNPRCSYVGDRGAKLVERRMRLIPRAKHVFFDDAWDVQIKYTRVFKRGYSGTNATFIWVDDEERPVVTLEGAFREYRIDREEIDLDAIDRLEPSHPVIALRVATVAFHEFIDAENAAGDKAEEPGEGAS